MSGWSQALGSAFRTSVETRSWIAVINGSESASFGMRAFPFGQHVEQAMEITQLDRARLSPDHERDTLDGLR